MESPHPEIVNGGVLVGGDLLEVDVSEIEHLGEGEGGDSGDCCWPSADRDSDVGTGSLSLCVQLHQFITLGSASGVVLHSSRSTQYVHWILRVHVCVHSQKKKKVTTLKKKKDNC